jgi:hypothetical protein
MGQGLYKIESPYDKATKVMSDSAATSAQMTKKTETENEKTVGGGLLTAGGGAAAGAAAGSAMAGAKAGSAGGYWGAAIGAVVGLLGYYLS